MDSKIVWGIGVLVVLAIAFFIYKKVTTKPPDSGKSSDKVQGIGTRNREMEKEIEGEGLIIYFPS